MHETFKMIWETKIQFWMDQLITVITKLLTPYSSCSQYPKFHLRFNNLLLLINLNRFLLPLTSIFFVYSIKPAVILACTPQSRSLSWHCSTPTTCTSAFVFSFPRQVFFSLPVLVSFTRSFKFSFSHLPFPGALWHNSDFSLLSPFLYPVLLVWGGGIVFMPVVDGCMSVCVPCEFITVAHWSPLHIII